MISDSPPRPPIHALMLRLIPHLIILLITRVMESHGKWLEHSTMML